MFVEQGVAGKANISAMPTFQVYQNGVLVKEFVGASKERLQALVAEFAQLA